MPLFLQGQPAFPPDIYFEQRAGHGIKPGGEDDVVKLVLNIIRHNPLVCQKVDWVLAHIDKCDVVTVVGRVVVGIDTQSFAANNPAGAKQLRNQRISNGCTNLFADKFRGDVVRVDTQSKVCKGTGEAETSECPSFFKASLDCLGVGIPDRILVPRSPGTEPTVHLPVFLTKSTVFTFYFFNIALVQVLIMCGH